MRIGRANARTEWERFPCGVLQQCFHFEIFFSSLLQQEARSESLLSDPRTSDIFSDTRFRIDTHGPHLYLPEGGLI